MGIIAPTPLSETASESRAGTGITSINETIPVSNLNLACKKASKEWDRKWLAEHF
ncbi:MAG: hypothetical protein BWY42_01176 [Candidatus Omnitrophica bacterium ADurb.Bin277]|nr:MAG: hypothetical protein BWY42_01176 [Candidatus Omnitrophica bacterium ADurb.Bin277]